MTDLSKWKLNVDHGRQTWSYHGDDPNFVQDTASAHHLGLDTSAACPPLPAATTPQAAAINGITFYEKVQTEDGHWAGDYGGPMFLLPGLVITCYITGVELKEAQKKEMIRYLLGLQTASGGWGIHIESDATMFGTALNYVVLRLLGVGKDEGRMPEARALMHKYGGATSIPSWGKFWLAALGVYDWAGLYPVPPEFWLLPDFLPLHPHRWWCHCRVVYLPMGYVYGRRATCPLTELTAALRTELYPMPYESIDWPSCCGSICELDVYTGHSLLHQAIFKSLSFYEAYRSEALREQALALTIDHIRSEDINTKHIDIGPVNKVINMLSVFWADGKDSPGFKAHVARLDDYLWLGPDGMKMQGYNGSQLWDTAFACQAIYHTGLGHRFERCLTKAYEYLEMTQVREDVADNEKYYRHISKGAWPFSTRDHGWPIADCTAEGLKATLLLQKLPFIDSTLLPAERLYEAVNVIFSLQNPSGGWATYELKRGPELLEKLNPSEVFGKIMVDYEYVECTSACVQALCMFAHAYPRHRTAEVRDSISRGVSFIKSIQRSDGSWFGSWGVCFTYGTWFGVEAFAAVGMVTDPAVTAACRFLLSKQKEDGGWGETFMSCVTKEYCDHKESQVVNTAWAVLTLLAAHWPDQKPIARGVKVLMDRQLPNGDWAQESISGVFNNNCMISYTAYRNVFPVWALGEYAKRYPVSKL